MTEHNEDARYTSAEVHILTKLTHLETLVNVNQESFSSHVKDDRQDFGKLFDANEHTLEEIGKIPERLIDCGSNFKSEIMKESEDKFVSVTDFKVFKTWIVTGVAAGSAVGAMIGIVINYAVSLKGLAGG